MHLCLLALASLLVGCASAPSATREPLPAGRSVDVRYVSRLAPAETHARMPHGADSAAKSVVPALPARPGESFVRIDCAQYQVDAGSLDALVREEDSRAFAFVAPRAQIQRVLDARVADGSAQCSGRPSLRVRDGATASISATSQQSFVESFEIARIGSDLVGDPRVATTEEGLTLEVRANSAAGTSVGVDVVIGHVQLLRPLLESNVHVPGAGLDLVVQVPLALRQELASAAELDASEVLVLGGILDRDGRHDVLVVIDARRDDGTLATLGSR